MATAADYEVLASALCDDPCPGGVDESERYCPPKDRDVKLLRFREATSEYSVMVRDTREIITYHLLYPVGTLGAPFEHGFATNRDFFEADRECRT